MAHPIAPHPPLSASHSFSTGFQLKSNTKPSFQSKVSTIQIQQETIFEQTRLSTLRALITRRSRIDDAIVTKLSEPQIIQAIT